MDTLGNLHRAAWRIVFGIPAMILGFVVGAIHAGFVLGWRETRSPD